MDLIDRERLLREFDIPKCTMPQESVIKVIKRQPRILEWQQYEREEGHWVRGFNSIGLEYFYCSQCHNRAHSSVTGAHEVLERFCSRCGAKMFTEETEKIEKPEKKEDK